MSEANKPTEMPHKPRPTRPGVSAGVTERNRRLGLKFMVMILFMFAFTFSLVFMYSWFAKWAGVNGRSNETPQMIAKNIKVDHDRWISVTFNADVPWHLHFSFKPDTESIRVHPGELVTVHYTAMNQNDIPITVHVTTSTDPGPFADSLKKVKSFNFHNLTFKPKETKNLAVTFYISPKIPKAVNDLDLSFALLNVEHPSAAW